MQCLIYTKHHLVTTEWNAINEKRNVVTFWFGTAGDGEKAKKLLLVSG